MKFRNKMPSYRKNQKGLTLVELMVGLLIALAIIAIAIVAFNGTRSSQRTQAMQSQLLQVVAAVQKIAPGPNYTGVTNTHLITTGHAPSDMVNGTNLVNRFGGGVTVAAASVAAGTDNGFTVQFTGVPRAECNAVLNSAHPTFAAVTVGTTVVKDLYAATPVAFSPTTAATACNNDTNSLTFTFAG